MNNTYLWSWEEDRLLVEGESVFLCALFSNADVKMYVLYCRPFSGLSIQTCEAIFVSVGALTCKV